MSFLVNNFKKVIGMKKPEESNLIRNSQLNVKTNINHVYNQDSFRKNSNQMTSHQDEIRKDQFELILEQSIIDYDYLRKVSWQGIPEVYRGKVWKLLLKYIPPNHQSQSIILNKKRNDYKQYIKNYFEALKESERDDNEKKIIKIIQADVNRTQPDCDLFRNLRIQALLARLLFIWNMRHPMSGYVQGINDIASPIIAVFLNEYIRIDFKTFEQPKELEIISNTILEDIEADTYWCLCKILENIQDYYTNNQPGVSDAFGKIKELVKIMDPELDRVLEENSIALSHFAFRWVYCLLIREFPLSLALRILDTYLAEDNFNELHIYTCANLLLKCSPEVKKKNFNETILFFQNLPTREWNETQIQMLLAEAYVFKTHFETTKGHLKPMIKMNNSFI